MPRILVVEDERVIAETLLFSLRADGHVVDWSSQAGEALARLRADPVDLVILDVGLPDMTGFDACRMLRSFSDVPVIFLTARSEEIDRVVGLELGADDYVVKPFSPRELAARVRTILRRRPPVQPAEMPAAPLQVDQVRRSILYHGQPLALTPHEYRLLECLVLQPQRVFSREQLLDSLGVSRDVGYERNIDGHVKELRVKLRAIAPDAEPIQTHRGFGYSYQPVRG